MRKGWALSWAAILLVASRALSAEAPPAKPYTIGIVPFYTAEKIWQLYQPFIQYLSGATPYTWELSSIQDHDQLVGALCRGEVAVALLGPMPYGKALGLCTPRPLVLSLGAGGHDHYHSVIVTADPAVRSLADLRGKKFALFEKSTAAHYLPLKMLADQGITLADITPVWVKSQDRLMAAILGNEVVAGGVKESLALKFASAGLRVLATSDPLPNFVFAATPVLPAAAGKSVADALLRLKPLEDKADAELVKTWDPELANGFSAVREGFDGEVRRLYQAMEPFGR